MVERPFLIDTFTKYIVDRRLVRHEEVLTGLATATFADGTLPTVDEIVREAAFLFIAGQETTARLLGADRDASFSLRTLRSKQRFVRIEISFPTSSRRFSGSRAL